jgi:hypothetical protein
LVITDVTRKTSNQSMKPTQHSAVAVQLMRYRIHKVLDDLSRSR